MKDDERGALKVLVEHRLSGVHISVPLKHCFCRRAGVNMVSL